MCNDRECGLALGAGWVPLSQEAFTPSSSAPWVSVLGSDPTLGWPSLLACSFRPCIIPVVSLASLDTAVLLRALPQDPWTPQGHHLVSSLFSLFWGSNLLAGGVAEPLKKLEPGKGDWGAREIV